MKFNEAWLREWVDPAVDTEALLRALAMAGIEIEGVEEIDCGFEGVVVGRVDDVQPHPNADRLRVCTVFDGAQSQQVVCGAANVRAGMVVPFAKLGASLQGGELRIKAAKLRGVESFGMLCSATELRIAESSEGLLPLPDDSQPGTALDALLPVRDRSIEVGLTPNRGDCLSMRGIAREVGVLFGAPYREPAITATNVSSAGALPVRVSVAAACPRYLGRVIEGVDLARPTPLWLRERLRRAGMRSIDPAVDVTNYVMLELGQPLHAFDLARLRGGVDVRLARDGEALEMLDGKQLALRTDTLVIADDNGPVALAGIMGGLRSGMQPGTTVCDVFLESAFFAPAAIRGRARAYGLHTEASQRFERGVDFELTERALERATALLCAIAGGRAGTVSRAEALTQLPARAPIRLRAARLARLVGVTIPAADVVTTLRGLEMRVDASVPDEWQVLAPSHRFDIEREEDLIEEVCRIYGYDRLPTGAPVTSLELLPVEAERAGFVLLRNRLVDLGYHEAITYSFIDPVIADAFAPGVPTLQLDNPLSSEMSSMRTSLLPGLVQAVRHNRNRQSARAKLFEQGRCFRLDAAGALHQDWAIGGVVAGARAPERWANDRAAFDFFDLKGDVERLVGGSLRLLPLSDDPALHPGQAANVLDVSGKVIGKLGRLHPALLERLDLDVPLLAFELDLAALVGAVLPSYAPFSVFPSVRRDLAVLVPREVAAAQVEEIARRAAGDLLVQFTLFDVYVGEGVDSEKKSLALGLTFQHRARTLEENEVGAAMAVVIAQLERECGAVRR